MLSMFEFSNNCWWAQARFASHTKVLKVLAACLRSVPTREDLRRWNLVVQSSFHHTTPLGGPDLILSRLFSQAEMIASWSQIDASSGSRDWRIEEFETYDRKEVVQASFLSESMWKPRGLLSVMGVAVSGWKFMSSAAWSLSSA